MADEVELTSLIVPIRADIDQLQMGFRKAQQEVRTAVAGIEAEMEKMRNGMTRSVAHGTMGAHSMMRMLHMAMRIPEIKSGQQALQQFGHMAMYVGRMFGPMGMLIGAGIGMGLMALKRFDEQLNISQKAANAAFGAVLKGAKSSQQALLDIKPDLLTKEFTGIVEYWNEQGAGGFFQRVFSQAMSPTGMTAGSMQEDMERSVERSMRAERLYTNLLESESYRRMQALIAPNRARSELQKEIDKLIKSGMTIGFGELAAASQRATVQMYLQSAGTISLAEAQERLAGETQRLAQLQDIAFGGDLLKKARTTIDEFARIGMGSNAAKVFQAAQEQAAKMSTPDRLVTATEVMRTHRRELDLYRRALAGLEVGKVAEDNIKLARELDLANIKLTQGADAAERYGRILDYARSNGVSLEVAERDLGKTLEQRAFLQQRLEGIKEFEGSMLPAEKYAVRIDNLQRLFNAGAISSETFGRQVLKANSEILKLDQAMHPTQAVKFPSAEAFSRLDEYRQRIVDMQPLINQGALAQGRAGIQASLELNQPPPVAIQISESAGELSEAGSVVAGAIGLAASNFAQTFSGVTTELGSSWSLAVSQSAQQWVENSISSGMQFADNANIGGLTFYNYSDNAGRSFYDQISRAAQILQDRVEQLARAQIPPTVPSGPAGRPVPQNVIHAVEDLGDQLAQYLPNGGGGSGFQQQLLTVMRQLAEQMGNAPTVHLNPAQLNGGQ